MHKSLFIIRLLSRPSPGLLSAILRQEGLFWLLSTPETPKNALMISAHLHGYAVRAFLQRLMHADVRNVRFWHTADIHNS
jgi:hypothetical protein